MQTTLPSNSVTCLTPKPTDLATLSRYRNLLAGFLLTLPITAFWVAWARLAVNVPKWDDHALKAFFLNLSHETTVPGQLYQFWRQHNEHRIVLDRLLTWADVQLFGQLDYTHLMIAGNLALVGLLFVFGRVLVRSGQWWGRVVPVAFFLFNLSQWENMFWGMAAPQNFGVVLWVIASLYALSFNTSLISPLLLAAAATLTSGNGLVIWPLGVVLLAIQRRWRGLAVWLFTAVVLIGTYFISYTAPANNPPTVPTLLTILTGTLAFLGSAAEALPVGTPFTNCVALGAVLLLLTGWFGVGLLRRWRGRATWLAMDIFFIGVAGFLIGTALVVARSRAGYGIETLITSRYKIYSLTLLSLLYVCAKPSQTLLRGLLGLSSILIAYLSYPAYRSDTEQLRRWLVTAQFNWTYTQNRPLSAIDPVTTRLLAKAPAFYDAYLPKLFGPATDSGLAIDSLFRQGDDWVVQNRTVALPATLLPDAGLYLRLQSNQRVYLVAARPTAVSGLRAKLTPLPVAGKGAAATLSPTDVAPATYRLDWLLVGPDGTCQLRPTGKTLAVISKPGTKQRPNTNW